MNGKPKPIRAVLSVEERRLLLWQRDGGCVMGRILQDGCAEGWEPHHIKTRGSGGDDSLDNMISLCRRHHIDAHAGRITKEQLRERINNT